ncbi:MAG TPA: hypothetical protein VGH11_10110, partial [Jatrophihabitans sp.]
GAWSAIDTIAIGVDYPPAVTSPALGELDVFWLSGALSGKLTTHQLTYDGTWGQPAQLGQQVYADLAAVSPEPGRIDLFGLSANGPLTQSTFAGGSWHPWTVVSTPSYVHLLADPGFGMAAVSTSARHIELFYAQDRTYAVHISYDGTTFTDPQLEPLPSDTGLSGVTASAGRIDLFAVGKDFAPFHGTYIAGVWSPFSQPAEIGDPTCTARTVLPATVSISRATTTIPAPVATTCSNYSATAFLQNGSTVLGPVQYQSPGASTTGLTFNARINPVGTYRTNLDNGYANGGTQTLNWTSTATAVKYATYPHVFSARRGRIVYLYALVKQYSSAPQGIIAATRRVTYLQRYTNRRWQNLLARTTNAAGAFAVALTQPHAYPYRLVTIESSTAWTGISATTLR